ncbi:arsenic resistance protein [Halomonas sp. ZH2S]|uniref:Arsenic resistance protein n=1 Tax=Vreelandella zhuhanensis TaxID=2684210 RepID=A0A7X3GXY3_9GAMM|nr:arsenic resistance protein [Halomonas zhuhanensis]MWJ26960.1 arsenic resistance protein [Halomonas zhuhanensis]
MPLALLERYQVIVYLLAIAVGLSLGAVFQVPDAFDALLWPLLAALLYITFSQIPLIRLAAAFRDRNFFAAALVGNFVCLPFVVAALFWLVPDDPALRLGVGLVLLVPCTDWFITFSQLGGGDTRHAIAFAPLSLLLQLMLLPFYLGWLVGSDIALDLALADTFQAFALVILVPLGLAFLTQCWAAAGRHPERSAERAKWLTRLGWLPVPLLGTVVGIIALTQVNTVLEATTQLPRLALVFSLFLLGAGFLARGLAWLFRLPVAQGRVLAFSLGTRNSFVVLPIALALPAGFEMTVIVVVFQSLVELLGMVGYLYWVPKKLFPKPCK